MKFTIFSFFRRIIALVSAFFLSLCAGNVPAPQTDAPADNAVLAYDGAAALRLDADASKTEHAISDLLYGAFFEDINFAADGGLYAEMVVNRSFEYTALAAGDGLHGWAAVNGAAPAVAANAAFALNANNPHYLTLSAPAGGGIENRGFLDGMAIEAGAGYRFSVYLRTEAQMPVTVRLTAGGETAAEAAFIAAPGDWAQYTCRLVPSVTARENVRLQLLLPAGGTAAADMVSLFPEDTFMGRENGLRRDLAEKVAQLRPRFLRFPGGCVTEGENEQTAYHWKDSVGADENGAPLLFNGHYGDVAARRQGENIWTDHAASEDPYPCFMTYGLGFFEYFQFAEDIGALGVPVLSAGLYCQMRGKGPVAADSPEFRDRIDDMLDLVEFCRGDSTTVWGRVRCDLGHEAPFELKYIAIGNENEGEDYYTRYALFLQALDAAKEEDPALYGDIELIYSAGAADALGGDNYLPSYAFAKNAIGGGAAADFAAATDQHYYRDPAWFLEHADYYDPENYRRSVAEMTDTAYGGALQVFLGEYAARSNRLEAALAEAAYMTGLERNGDIVRMAAYAPLFGNLTARHWAPDLIWFDNAVSTGSISYYMQKLFSVNAGAALLSHTLTGAKKTDAAPLAGRVGVGTWYTEAAFDNLTLTDNATGKTVACERFTLPDFLWNWQNPNKGNFKIKGGQLVHEGADMNYSDIGDVAYYGWDGDLCDYTYTVEATKRSGEEGFLIPFAVQDRDNNLFWNIGGWGNTVSCLQKMENGVKTGKLMTTVKPFTVETGRTYLLTVRVDGTRVRCYIDGELMVDCDFADTANADLYTVVSRDTAGDVIVKLVNVTGQALPVAVKLDGLADVPRTAAVQQVRGKSPDDDNILGQPEACKIEDFSLELPGAAFTYAAPAYSATVIRLVP